MPLKERPAISRSNQARRHHYPALVLSQLQNAERLAIDPSGADDTQVRLTDNLQRVIGFALLVSLAGLEVHPAAGKPDKRQVRTIGGRFSLGSVDRCYVVGIAVIFINL